MSVSRDIKDFTKLIFFSLLTCLIKYMKITSGLWDIINKVVTKLKKTAHAYFWAPYFSKSFGGKIRHNWTDVTYRIKLKKKKRRMRIISTRIFLSFLAGKIKIFEQPLIQPFRATKNCSWKSPTKSRNNISLHFSSDSPCFWEKYTNSVLFLC